MILSFIFLIIFIGIAFFSIAIGMIYFAWTEIHWIAGIFIASFWAFAISLTIYNNLDKKIES